MHAPQSAFNSTLHSPDVSDWRPSPFACAVAALAALDGTNESSTSGVIFLNRPAASGWRAWARATCWSLNKGDTLYGNFEVCDQGQEPRCGVLLPHGANAERKAWGAGKVQQLEALVREVGLGRHPALHWMAAMLDVMPIKDLGDAVNFQLSRTNEEVEMTGGNVLMHVKRASSGSAWDLTAGKRLGLAPLAERTVTLDSDKHESLRQVLFDGWVTGRRLRLRHG